MPVHNVFDAGERDALIARIDTLQAETRPRWGKMNAAQMLAHNSLIFEGALNDTYPTMNPVLRWVVSRLIRGAVIGDRPYIKNSRTVPAWVVADPRDFEKEKDRLLGNIARVHELGPSHFEGKHNPTFGRLTAAEWNRVFIKHLDYHLDQFGV